MSLKIGFTEPTVLKVIVSRSKFDNTQPIYSITMDDEEYYGKPTLTLQVGVTYRFEINAPKCPFYITSDPQGGGIKKNEVLSMVGAIEITPENTDEKGNVGITKGILTWTPQYIHQNMKLYYQCDHFSDMGGEIKIIL